MILSDFSVDLYKLDEGGVLPAGDEFRLQLVLEGELDLAFKPARTSRTTWALN